MSYSICINEWYILNSYIAQEIPTFPTDIKEYIF